ncbi:ATP-dependent helicase C-terminal domain-containing protein [uncultured Treponema sp.]|uniref:ATP-dependent RNA helicase n=1 Tax=uncultured Treponema sp. TaxID=162155 RepID=UPI0025F26F34|nr:ATP-dependent helicase C-terminal domain-containing protein [uncultured Treponema sp.]
MPDFSRAHDLLSSLPVVPFLNEICDTLKSSESRFLVLTAETAAGKSTAVPIALLEHFEGKILMLEPRRLAARAIADRLSDLLGEETGKSVGYRLHLDSKTSSATRLEVITEAILTRRLQADPLLEDVSVIVLDEFHERSIHSDLALAFLKETMLLRDDLFVIVMSATINSRSLSEYLGNKEKPAPVMQIPGRQFPVEIEYKPNVSVAEAIFDEVNKNAMRGYGETLLAFLPGIYEIRKTKSELELLLSNQNLNTEILILHSSVPVSEQRKVLSPLAKDSCQRVILSSAIAETSLTVPGVRVVIDSGLCRMNKMNVALGMEHLVTEKESRFSAEQRAGRAGRLAAGKCIRLWDKNDPLIEQNVPEILRADLTQLVLECAQWGSCEIEKLSWLTVPNASAWKAACMLLEMLDCLEVKRNSAGTDFYKITTKGKAILKLGLHPRLACVALAGGAESALPFSEYAEASVERQQIFLNDLKKRLSQERQDFAQSEKMTVPVLSGFPDRLAMLSLQTPLNAERAEYHFPSGRTAWLTRENLVSQTKFRNTAISSGFPKWIVAPEVDAGERTGKIYSFECVSDEQAENFLKNHAKTEIRIEFVGQSNGNDFKNLSIQKKEITVYGELVLKEKKMPADSGDFALALCDLVRKRGLTSLPLDGRIEEFLLRAEFYIKYAEKKADELGEKYASLSQNAEKWLRPFVKSQKINAQDIFDALYWYLDGADIDSKVPLQITLPNGRKRKIKYEKKADGEIQPTLEIIIQQIFGCFETPKILGKPVLLKLLSPASRPLQITDDLEHFWSGAWTEICKEMKGRYPKHNWDYRVSERD